MDIKIKQKNRIRRHKRVRALIKGTSERPRLSVFRSNKHIYVQLIDDTKGATFFSASDSGEVRSKKFLVEGSRAKPGIAVEVRKKENSVGKKAMAFKIGEILAKKALEKGIKVIVFDRGGYKYHGRVKALAEGARKGGLKF